MPEFSGLRKYQNKQKVSEPSEWTLKMSEPSEFLSLFGGLWKHQNNPAYTKNVRAFRVHNDVGLNDIGLTYLGTTRVHVRVRWNMETPK